MIVHTIIILIHNIYLLANEIPILSHIKLNKLFRFKFNMKSNTITNINKKTNYLNIIWFIIPICLIGITISLNIKHDDQYIKYQNLKGIIFQNGNIPLKIINSKYILLCNKSNVIIKNLENVHIVKCNNIFLKNCRNIVIRESNNIEIQNSSHIHINECKNIFLCNCHDIDYIFSSNIFYNTMLYNSIKYYKFQLCNKIIPQKCIIFNNNNYKLINNEDLEILYSLF